MSGGETRARDEDAPAAERVLDLLAARYHVLTVAALALFMLWTRVRGWQRFVVNGEVLFSGNDPWYHFRQVSYTVRNWPETMPFDPWTYFPFGTSSGQFGTLYDQIVATVALVVGLGNPSEGTVAMVVLFAPVAFGVLAVVPAYYIGRHLGDRPGGVVAVAVVALNSGSFYQRSAVGFADHHVVEALFMGLGVLGTMVALGAAREERPIYEQVLDRDFDALRRPLAWSLLAGVAVGTYMWVWPPGVLLVGVLGTFFLLQLSIEFLRGGSPEHTAFVGAVSMGAAAVTAAASIRTLGIDATDSSLLQPGLALLVAVGCVFMAWLARRWEAGDYARSGYAGTVFGLIGAGLVGLAVLTPDLFGFFVNQFFRIFGFPFIDAQSAAQSVGEVSPLLDPGRLFQTHGFAVFLAAGGAAAIVVRQFLDDVAPEKLLVVVWAVFITAATFTQARFAYYFTFPVAALTGYVVGALIDRLELAPPDLEFYQVGALATIVLVVVAPMVLVAPVTAASSANAPGGGIQGWSESLSWMDDHTPEEGLYDDDEQELDYYGTYPATGDFDYEPGSYGVLSWWDYGHWITAQGERIPTANPFQQGATSAADFLLAPNESYAGDVIRRVSETDAGTRYVMVDWKMANVYSGQNFGGKYFAPPRFSNLGNASDYYRGVFVNVNDRLAGPMYYHTQDYYESMVIRLYRFHGSAATPQPFVFDWERQTNDRGTFDVVTRGQQNIRTFDSMAAAREYVRNDTTAIVGGVGPFPSERVPALEHYRLVGTSDTPATESAQFVNGLRLRFAGVGSQNFRYFGTTPLWTKVFERVDGATIEGTGPANATVRANVTMRIPASNETFQYRTRARTAENGSFSMTVPYSTTGYDEYGPDNGRTNVSVRAEGPYTLQAVGQTAEGLFRYNDTVDVPEGAVIGEESGTITADLERTQVASFNTSAGGGGGSADGGGGNGDGSSAIAPVGARP